MKLLFSVLSAAAMAGPIDPQQMMMDKWYEEATIIFKVSFINCKFDVEMIF
jgi:hypothetical protein